MGIVSEDRHLHHCTLHGAVANLPERAYERHHQRPTASGTAQADHADLPGEQLRHGFGDEAKIGQKWPNTNRFSV